MANELSAEQWPGTPAPQEQWPGTPVQQAQPPGYDVLKASGDAQRISNAFDLKPNGMSQASADTLKQNGITTPDDAKPENNPAQAVSEHVVKSAFLHALPGTMVLPWLVRQAELFADLVKGPGEVIQAGVAGEPKSIEELIPMAANIAMASELGRATPFKAPAPKPLIEERIGAAAVRAEDGTLFTGIHHGEALEAAEAAGYDAKSIKETDGFITNDGRYVDRKEAARIASKADQIQTKEEYFAQRPDLSPKTRAIYERDLEAARAGEGQLGAQQLRTEPSPIDLTEAKRLRAIGDESPPPANESPPEAAKRAMAADAKPDEKITLDTQDEWMDRVRHTVSKIDKPDDARRIILDAVPNINVDAIRSGELPVRDVQELASAAGLKPGELDPGTMSRKFRNDDTVRGVITAALQATDEVKAAASAVDLAPTPENLIKMQQAIDRHALLVEQWFGHRAEWGRTGNVFQEFMTEAGEARSINDMLKDRGTNLTDLKTFARAIKDMDREGAARLLNDKRTYGFSDKLFYYWVNSLISGPITHTGYVQTNAVYAAMEHMVVTPMSAAIGKVKQLAGVQAERQFFGEGLASPWGMVMAAPDIVRGTYQSIKTGMRIPLESEIELFDRRVAQRDAMIARGEEVPKELDQQIRKHDKLINTLKMERPISGAWGRAIGSPGDVAGGIHTAFKLAGERGMRHMEAYRATVEEGLDPTSSGFTQRYSYHLVNPTDAALERATAGAYKGTYMQDLGTKGKDWQRFVHNTPLVRWAFPFNHIPLNIIKNTAEYVPLLNLADTGTRDALMGRKGGIEQDRAIARMVVGSSIMGYFAYKAMNGQMTGDYPDDPKEKAEWALLHKQAHSVLVGGEWVSLDRKGPVGNLAKLGATIGTYATQLKTTQDEADMTAATANAAISAARIAADETGMMTLRDAIDLFENPHRRSSIAANRVTSFIPLSSMAAQTASYTDPDMRKAQTFLDSIKYRIPGLRQTLPVKMDWSGQPVPNPGYQNINRAVLANTDPVDLALVSAGVHPGMPHRVINGVKLNDQQYEQYVSIAGGLARQTLEKYVTRPEWANAPAAMRAEVLRDIIKTAHEGAAAAIQVRNPALIQQGVEQRRALLTAPGTPKLAGSGDGSGPPSAIGEFFKNIAKGVSGMLPATPPPEPTFTGGGRRG